MTITEPGGQQSYGKTFYVFDGDLLLGEVRMQPQYPGSGSIPVVMAAYTWGADGLVSERLNNGAADLTNGRSLWYAFGPQGETRQLTDSSGLVVDSYSYTAYGVPIASAGSDVNPFQYGGQAGYYADGNNGAGLILCTNRWYSPSLGRWLSRDPIGYGGGENLYRYSDCDPINRLDPSGLRPDDDDDPNDPANIRLGSRTSSMRFYGRGLQAIGKGGQDVLNGAASFNPICNASVVISGQQPSGRKARGWDRLWAAAAIVPYGRVAKLFTAIPAAAMKCEKAAVGAFRIFRQAGKEAEIVQIIDKGGILHFFAANGEKFSETGIHLVTRSEGRYFDALTGALVYPCFCKFGLASL